MKRFRPFLFPSFLCTGIALGEKPSLVLILTDDQGHGGFGCFGSTIIRTPQLNRLAKEDRKFTSFVTLTSVCTPSRIALPTGSYPKHVGLAKGVPFNLPEYIGEGKNPANANTDSVKRLRQRMMELGAGIEAGALPVWRMP